MLGRVLVANRGEIAVRVIRACRDLGVRSVAVYSEVDRHALHVRLADEAWPCGPAPARDSYLNVAALVRIAREAGADAVHPGYGFLSEKGDFADACREAGLVFIGPAGAVIRQMGDKVTSRRTMRAAGVPIVPGTTERLTDAELAGCAAEIGYPVMVKASAGGGGKGLRRVNDPGQLEKAVPRARSEAQASFGDDGLYLEKCIEQPRHVEVQVLADRHGNVVHLFERECSIQRRHQKLIEEAPANGVTPELRRALGEAAVSAARAVGYEGAGTIEFLLDRQDRFYFLEMNTRIQVEHPVTEAVTGVDLVTEQLRIAAGEPLSFVQQDLQLRGHAIEVRIYAEDPDKGFLPSPGIIAVWRVPKGPGIRVDDGVAAGQEVTVHYDPLVAKLVASGSNREQAIARLHRALAEFVVAGIRTSIPFHRRVVEHPLFRAGRYDTGFIDAQLGQPEPAEVREAERVIAFALAAWALRLREPGATRFRVEERKDERAVEILQVGEAGRYEFAVAGERLVLEIAAGGQVELALRQEGRPLEATLLPRGDDAFEIGVAGYPFRLKAAPA